MKQLIAAFSLRFAHLDKDMDGQISIVEAKEDKEVMRQFADLDEDGDEKVSKKEFESFKP